MVKGKKTMIYEAYGAANEYIFVDVRKCFGQPKVSFYQTDYQNLAEEKSMKFKVIKDENSFVQYVKLEHQKVFMKVENEKGDLSAYTLNAFSEKDMDENPYTEITQEGDGKVDVETDNHRVRVEPLRLKSNKATEFTNKITYYLYLSSNMKIMRYAKNCGKHMIHKAFEDSDLLEFSHVVHMDNNQVSSNNKKKSNKLDKVLKRNHVNIKFSGLDPNKKYYGIVVAKVDLFPSEEGFLTPVRSGKSYYDEFIIVTPRFVLPIQLIISTLIILGLLCGLFCIVKSYIFENISLLNEIGEKIPESLKEFDDESSFGFKAFSLLEKAYHEEKRRIEDSQAEQEQEEQPASEQGEDTVDMQSEPSEVELQTQNDTSTPLDA
jgi:hypothetical protein